VVDAVAAALRDQLLDGVLAPGQVLRDTDLAEEFGVARPTIRAAVQVLVADGLVIRDRGRSARVPLFPPTDIADLYTARAAIELAAIDLIERSAPPIDRLAVSFARLQALPVDAAWRDVVDADVDFHQSLVATAGSTRLLRLFDGLANETRLVIALQRALYESVEDLVAEHRRILTAMKRKRFDTCRRLLREHFDHTVAALSVAPTRQKDIS
jgi:DNA-binding GntR family transcriptional regulator